MALTMLVRILCVCVCAHICVVTLQCVKTELAAVVKAYKFSRIQAISCAAFPLLRSGFNFDIRRPRRFFSYIPDCVRVAFILRTAETRRTHVSYVMFNTETTITTNT